MKTLPARPAPGPAKMTHLTIDSHQHFWRLSAPWCNWPTSAEEAIHRDFSPEDVLPHLSAAGIDKTIVVQAAPDVRETRSLLELADNNDFIAGVVGWVDFEKPEQALSDIGSLSQNPKFLGVRPMLQSIEEVNWILRPEFGPIFAELISRQLVFDALIKPAHITTIKQLAARYPDLKVIIDHAAKPDIVNRVIMPWATELTDAAQRQNIFCKLSGLLTESQPGDGFEILKPYVQKIFAAFGPKRVLWGSDWPVVKLNGDYAKWHEMSAQFTETFSESERYAIFGGNAARLYNPPL